MTTRMLGDIERYRMVALTRRLIRLWSVPAAAAAELVAQACLADQAELEDFADLAEQACAQARQEVRHD